MNNRRSTSDLRHNAALLRGTRDVAIGAFARRQRRWRVLLGLLGLGLIAGAGWLIAVVLRDDSATAGGLHPLVVECVKCGQRSTVTVDAEGGQFPLECPKCRERACHKLWECRSCGELFLNKSGAAELVCPRCSSTRVGAATRPAPAAEKPEPNGPG